jgi:predicted SAM-dependent methyltransferase
VAIRTFPTSVVKTSLRSLSFVRRFLSSRLVPFNREAVAHRFLRGDGIEIGALHNPLSVPGSARVRYVDRLPVPELERQYPELRGEPLVDVDIVDDGERLARVPDASQDFVIANHFLEHCQDPLGALESMFRVLRPGGVLYLAVPDKRHTFDVDRPPTPVDHVLQDHRAGPGGSRREHFEEWARLVDRVGEREVEHHVSSLLEADYSIHFHVWEQSDVFDVLQVARREVGLAFDVEFAARNGHENLFILRKSQTSGR